MTGPSLQLLTGIDWQKCLVGLRQLVKDSKIEYLLLKKIGHGLSILRTEVMHGCLCIAIQEEGETLDTVTQIADKSYQIVS